MTTRTWGEEYRTTIVCVDSYEDRIPSGRIFNPYAPEGRSFSSVMQFLLEMEQILNSMDFPKSFTAARFFATPAETAAGPPEADVHTGNKATFALRILFRQNASWQGSVTWLEGRQEQSFRSVLELVLLMDSAMTVHEAPQMT